MMVTRKAGGAAPGVFPPRWIAVGAVNVGHRAHLLALAATDANAGVDNEFVIGDPVLEEKSAKHDTVDARPAALVDSSRSPLSVHDDRNHRRQFITGRHDLAPGTLGRVNLVDKWEIVGLGHDERESTIKSYTDVVEVPGHVIKGLAHIVATRGKSVTILATVALKFETLDEISDKEWWSPAMDGEAEAQTLIFGQLVLITAAGDSRSDGNEALACCLRQLMGNKPGVASASEIEYHCRWVMMVSMIET